MVQVITLTACGRHNRCIGNRRAMVTANRTCKTSRHCDNLHWVARFKNCNNDRNKNTEGTPACACCKRNTARNEEYNCRQEALKLCGNAAHSLCNKRLCTENTCHILQRGCKRKNKYCRNHCIEALWNTLHSLLEGNNPSCAKPENRKYKRNQAAPRKTDSSVGIRKCLNERSALKYSTYINK